jgi:hypothetical protein
MSDRATLTRTGAQPMARNYGVITGSDGGIRV